MASAVILPDAEETPQPPSLKRRRSSISENDSKRRRVSHDEDTLKQELGPTPPIKADTRNRQQEGGQVAEERKRGRRLFGALLGTLSQSSSSSTAHKRRSDIEKKQQAKLKQQTEEADEEKKEKLEALMKVRRKEQRIYDRQSVCFMGERWIYKCRVDPSTDEDPSLQSHSTSALPENEGRTRACTSLVSYTPKHWLIVVSVLQAMEVDSGR